MRRKELARAQRLSTTAAEQDTEGAVGEKEDALLDYGTDEDDFMQVVSL